MKKVSKQMRKMEAAIATPAMTVGLDELVPGLLLVGLGLLAFLAGAFLMPPATSRARPTEPCNWVQVPSTDA